MLQLAGLAAMTLGVSIILSLPIDALLCAAAAIIWCVFTLAEILQLTRMHKRFSSLRVYADGTAELCRTDGAWQAAVITHGSLVLPRVAWLRVRLREGGCYRVLLRGDSRESKQWRRLQVIWRHLGTAG